MKFAVKLVLALTVSCVMLWLAFRSVDFDSAIQQIADTDLRMVLAFLGLQCLMQVCRILRWGQLVRPFSDVSTRQLFSIGGLGMLLILALPLRLGEFARPYLLKRETGAPLSSGLAAAVIERAIDGLLVTLLFFLTTTLISDSYEVSPTLKGAAFVALGVFSAATIVSISALLTRGVVPKLLRCVGGPISPALTDKAVGVLEAFVDGLRALPDWRAIAMFTAWTAVYWGANGYGMYLLAVGMGFDVPVVAGFTLVSILVIGIMLPAGPGFLGPYQAALVWGLAIFGIDETGAAAYSLVSYPFTVLAVLIFGVPWLVLGRTNVSEIVRESTHVDEAQAVAEKN